MMCVNFSMINLNVIVTFMLELFNKNRETLAKHVKCRSGRPEVFCKKGVLRNFTKFKGNHLCQSLFFNKVDCNFIKKETLARVFSCEFCGISKNTFFNGTPLVAASVHDRTIPSL